MTERDNPVLKIDRISVQYELDEGQLHAVRDVSLQVGPGEVVGVVGESGSGKSTLGYAVLGALEANGRISGGKIFLRSRDITQLSNAEHVKLRGSQIALVPQDPPTALNPTISVGDQVAEVLRYHEGLSKDAARARTLELLREVNLPGPEQIYDRFPYELSGGQQQRIVIAMAFACRPKLLIMDEPTTGLDVTSEAKVLELLREMISEYGTSVLYISHNLGTIVNISDRVIVMYAGEVVEEITAKSLTSDAKHPYTKNLLACIPSIAHHKKLQALEGELPDLRAIPAGCAFTPRCNFATELCGEKRPEAEAIPSGEVRCWNWRDISLDTTPSQVAETAVIAGASQPARDIILSVENLYSHYRIRRSLIDVLMRRPPRKVRAVDGISFEVERGTTLAIVGESGCGKTTLGRTLLGLQSATSGKIIFDGEVLPPAVGARSHALRRKIQAVFQNPEQTLNPKKSIARILARPLSRAGRDAGLSKIVELLRSVRMPADAYKKYPRQLSGGQKQRIAIARAFATNPQFIVCDEPLSALDVSVQAAIVNLLIDLQRQGGTTYVFISHDLPLVAYFAQQIAVMYLGKICEIGRPEQVLSPPYHPYTEALLGSIPLIDTTIAHRRVVLEGPVQAGSENGCIFAARCPRKLGSVCDTETPPVREFGSGHRIACHIPEEDLLAIPPVFGIGDKTVPAIPPRGIAQASGEVASPLERAVKPGSP